MRIRELLNRLTFTLFALLLFGSTNAFAGAYDPLSHVVPPSACRVGAVISTEQFLPGAPFLGPGRSNVVATLPNEEVVAGRWVILNNFVPRMGVVTPPNCTGPLGSPLDGAGLNLMGVRLHTTISSPQNADIEYVKLVWDVNVNGVWDPLLDLVIDTRPGSDLLQDNGALFYHGPQNPLAVLSNSVIGCNTALIFDDAPAVGIGPVSGTNSRLTPSSEGCYIGFLAIVKIGDQPIHRTKFGLDLEAIAGDIPGSPGNTSFTFSSGFSSSRNPQASNQTVDIFGGLPGPTEEGTRARLNRAVTNAEDTFTKLEFTGGQNGDGLKSRFRAKEIGPGTREAIVFAGALCDGGPLATDRVPILPTLAGTPPQIAGGLISVPCVPAPNTDGVAAGIISAILHFEVSQSIFNLLGTVRLYADMDCDGIFFEAGELVQQRVPYYNHPTTDAYAFFNRKQDGVLRTPAGIPVAGGCPFGGGPAGFDASPLPLILIWTVDINEDLMHSANLYGPHQARAQQVDGVEVDGDIEITSTTPVNIPTSGEGDCEGTSCVPDDCIAEEHCECIDDDQCFDPCPSASFGPNCFFQSVPENVNSQDLLSKRFSIKHSHRLGSLLFEVRGSPPTSTQVTIFDLKGQLVYSSRVTSSNLLRWNLRNKAHRPAANGVYFYVITAIDEAGKIERSVVKKLVLLR